jgi:hypothetical protein
VPLKKLIPTTAKVRINKKLITITLNNAGNELNNALTTSLRPSFLLMTLSGLNALRALNAFNDFKDDFLDI